MEKFEILSSQEELIKSMEAEAAPTQEAVVEDYQPASEPTDSPIQQAIDDSGSIGAAAEPQQQQEATYSEPSNDFSDSDIESAVVTYLSERLGKQLSSIDDLMNSPQSQIDERVAAIAQFVQETGRAPEDWFRFQALNPSEMDDMTAVRVSMASEYPNLSYEEINLLLDSKYKLNPDIYEDGEVRLSQLQLKIDAQKAKQSIEEVRSRYAAPEKKESQYESIIDDTWVNNMYKEVDALEGIEFDLGNGNTFTFGIDDKLRNNLKQKNSQLPNFFDSYVRDNGTWDYDLLSSHMTVIDNIDSIVKSAYQKGLGDGQRSLVDKAANVSVGSPQQQNINNQADPVIDQLKNIIGMGNTLTFKI
jgi:hypothetical protein